jgi:hypothetical protein
VAGAGRNDLAYVIAVAWVFALGFTAVVGLVLVLVRPLRPVGRGVLVGTVLALALELLVSAVLVSLWLSAHPEWELS